MSPQTQTAVDPLAADYPDEHSARAEGWRCVTSGFTLPRERHMALHVLAGLRGQRPGHKPVPCRIVGTARRISFARLESELVHVIDEDDGAPLDELPGDYCLPLHLLDQ